MVTLPSNSAKIIFYRAGVRVKNNILTVTPTSSNGDINIYQDISIETEVMDHNDLKITIQYANKEFIYTDPQPFNLNYIAFKAFGFASGSSSSYTFTFLNGPGFVLYNEGCKID